MEYSIHALSKLAGVSTRTLRWYHTKGLLLPSRIGENGYRHYSAAEVDRLQQILFFRELGVELEKIRLLLDDPSYQRLDTLRGHLFALKSQQQRISKLIALVEDSIYAEERNETMSDTSKFEAFKQNLITENEEKYGTEIREKYGERSVEQSNAALLSMTQEQYTHWQTLSDEILSKLEQCVTSSEKPEGNAGKAVTELHRQWLSMSGSPYSPAMHRGIAEMYVADERFTAFYDRNQSGCARFLRDAIHAHVQIET